MDPKGKYALVTGGATGIGLAYVKELLRHGVQAVAVADLDERKGDNSVKQLNDEFGAGKAIFIKCDVTNKDDLEATFRKAAATFKGLDIVINNAGILDDSRWETEIAINVTAVARGTWLAFDLMGKNKGGRGGVVVNIASILGLQAMAGCPVYVATKHAVVGLSRSFGMPYHFDRTGVRVLTMCPGVTDTPLISEAHHRQFTDDLGKECGRELDALPKQKPENVAKGMLHIICKASNGSVWVSEGGQPVYEVAIPERETIRVAIKRP
uniref:Putative alcohol dehydrogenase n=1 Tax=Gryllotalpa orientalis TaxID=213494 RepID=Q6RUR3_GRYOR|nr:putative alcohol dehydrogenase [Gryllotalpa orientalis]